MTGLIWLGVRFNQNLRQLIFIFFDLPTNIDIITIFLIFFFFFAKLQLYFIVIILMKMYHIAIVPSNYPIFLCSALRLHPPPLPPFSICLLHICIIIRYMYYAAYNTDLAVVIGIKAVLNLSEQ